MSTLSKFVSPLHAVSAGLCVRRGLGLVSLSLLALVWVAPVLVACGGDEKEVEDEQPSPGTPSYLEGHIAGGEIVAFEPGHQLALGLEPGDHGGADLAESGHDHVPFHIGEARTMTFCFDERVDEREPHSFRLRSDKGEVLVDAKIDGGCHEVEVPAGKHVIEAVHGHTDHPEARIEPLFLRPDVYAHPELIHPLDNSLAAKAARARAQTQEQELHEQPAYVRRGQGLFATETLQDCTSQQESVLGYSNGAVATSDSDGWQHRSFVGDVYDTRDFLGDDLMSDTMLEYLVVADDMVVVAFSEPGFQGERTIYSIPAGQGCKQLAASERGDSLSIGSLRMIRHIRGVPAGEPLNLGSGEYAVFEDRDYAGDAYVFRHSSANLDVLGLQAPVSIKADFHIESLELFDQPNYSGDFSVVYKSGGSPGHTENGRVTQESQVSLPAPVLPRPDDPNTSVSSIRRYLRYTSLRNEVNQDRIRVGHNCEYCNLSEVRIIDDAGATLGSSILPVSLSNASLDFANLSGSSWEASSASNVTMRHANISGLQVKVANLTNFDASYAYAGRGSSLVKLEISGTLDCAIFAGIDIAESVSYYADGSTSGMWSIGALAADAPGRWCADGVSFVASQADESSDDFRAGTCAAPGLDPAADGDDATTKSCRPARAIDSTSSVPYVLIDDLGAGMFDLRGATVHAVPDGWPSFTGYDPDPPPEDVITLSGFDLSGALANGFNLEVGMPGFSEWSPPWPDMSKSQCRDSTGMRICGVKNVQLTGANFHQTCLNDVAFYNSTIPSADFGGATLRGALFHAVNLESASFSHAEFAATGTTSLTPTRCNPSAEAVTNANFRSTSLDSADFAAADVSGASMIQASLNGTTFDANSTLNELSVTESVIEGVDWSGLTLRAGNFTNTVFFNSDLSGATFEMPSTGSTGAHFKGATFAGTSLNGTTLEGADLSDMLIVQQLDDGQDCCSNEPSRTDCRCERTDEALEPVKLGFCANSPETPVAAATACRSGVVPRLAFDTAPVAAAWAGTWQCEPVTDIAASDTTGLSTTSAAVCPDEFQRAGDTGCSAEQMSCPSSSASPPTVSCQKDRRGCIISDMCASYCQGVQDSSPTFCDAIYGDHRTRCE